MIMSTENIKKTNKTAVIVTYVIAVLLLVAGWFIPLFGYEVYSNASDQMMFWYIPAALNAALMPFTGSPVISGSFVEQHPFPEFLNYSNTILPKDATQIQMLAILLLVYAVVTVLALVMIIPVCLGKKDKKTSIISAYVGEGAALFTLGLYFFFFAFYNSGTRMVASVSVALVYYNLNLVAVGAAVLVLLFIQSIMQKKSLGTVKVILFLFSLFVVICLFEFDSLLTYAASEMGISVDGWYNMLNSIKTGTGLYTFGEVPVTAFMLIVYMVSGLSAGQNFIWIAGESATANILRVAILALGILAIINLIIDFCGLMSGNKTDETGIVCVNKGSKVFSLVRYIITLVVAIVALVCIFIESNVTVGINLYLITFWLLIAVIISAVRVGKTGALAIKAREQHEARMRFVDQSMTAQNEEQTDLVSDTTVYVAPATAEEPATEEPVATAEAAEQPAEETAEEPATTQITEDEEIVGIVGDETTETTQTVEETTDEPEQLSMDVPGVESDETPAAEPVVYHANVNRSPALVYDGPTDEFIDTLTVEQKIEFSKVFFDKSQGTLPAGMPDYEVGESNKDFFPEIFIHLGKFRSMLSSGLLRKIYLYHSNNR